MVTLEVFIKRFAKLRPFIEKRAQEIMMSMEEEILEMQRSQHHAGLNADGKTMQRGYSKGYSKKRAKKSLQVKYVDLHFSGKYHKSLDLVPVKGGMDVQSKEPYAWYLRAHFPKMAGLTKQNAKIVKDMLTERLAPEIKQFLIK